MTWIVDVVVLALEAHSQQTNTISSRIIVAAPSEDSKAIYDSDSFSRNNGERAYKESSRVESSFFESTETRQERKK